MRIVPARDPGLAVARLEDAMCLERLRGLCTAGEEHACVWGSTLVDLGEFVSGLNAPRPPGPFPDTVFVNTEMHDMLFRGIPMGNGRLGGDPYH